MSLAKIGKKGSPWRYESLKKNLLSWGEERGRGNEMSLGEKNGGEGEGGKGGWLKRRREGEGEKVKERQVANSESGGK